MWYDSHTPVWPRYHGKYSANDLTKGNFLIKFRYKYLFEMDFFLFRRNPNVLYALQASGGKQICKAESIFGQKSRTMREGQLRKKNHVQNNEASNCALSTNYYWTNTLVKSLEKSPELRSHSTALLAATK